MGIEERAGQAFGAEHLGPFIERQVGGDQSGPAASVGDYFSAVFNPIDRTTSGLQPADHDSSRGVASGYCLNPSEFAPYA